tara:strand:- start:737 stop:994 length:258 start_codon:yes stop_codon:yes gene_type:complete
MSNKKQVKPKWFTGVVYDKGTTVQNRFGGDSCELNALELSIYDFIIGASNMAELGMHHDKLIVDLRKGLDWFREHNAKAYMILLD